MCIISELVRDESTVKQFLDEYYQIFKKPEDNKEQIKKTLKFGVAYDRVK